MLQEQLAPAWGNHPPGSPVLPLVGGDAATAMREEPVSNLTPLLKQNLSLGEVILLQKRKDKQMLPYRFSALTVPTRQHFQECRWDYSVVSPRTLIYKHSTLSWLALGWGCLCSLLPFMQLHIYRKTLMATFPFLLPLASPVDTK